MVLQWRAGESGMSEAERANPFLAFFWSSQSTVYTRGKNQRPLFPLSDLSKLSVPRYLLLLRATFPGFVLISRFSYVVRACRSWAMAGLASSLSGDWREKKWCKGIFAVSGIMVTLVTYGVLQEKIMRIPYGADKEYFKYSLFLVFCNRITTTAISAGSLLASKKKLTPAAPIYKYCVVSVTNILTTSCQYEALKYVSFPVQTLAKCAKMIPVMIWGTIMMQKRYVGHDYFLAFLVTLGCSIFILYPAGPDLNPYGKGRENTAWGAFLMIGYLGFDGFTSTFQDKLFKGYDMEIHNQIFYVTFCSCVLSLTGLILQGHLVPAFEFGYRHNDCFFDVALLSTVATLSQFFISYTIRTFGALTFATIMTTRQLVSIMLSCAWFGHPLSLEQWFGAVVVFGSLYTKSFLKAAPQKIPSPEPEPLQSEGSNVKSIP